MQGRIDIVGWYILRWCTCPKTVPSRGTNQAQRRVTALVFWRVLPVLHAASIVTDLFTGRSLLVPTRIYVGSTLQVMRSGLVKAAAHITGGGLPGNIARILPDSLAVHLDASSWTMPPVFGWISHMVTLCHRCLLQLTFLLVNVVNE